MTDSYGDLTRCPACDDDLGVAPSHEPDGRARRPSLRLELCGENRLAMEWRLSLWDSSKSWPPSPGFQQAQVHLVYRVCGDGHVFLDHLMTGGARLMGNWRVDQFDVIAAVGGEAAGKSYLMLRTLSQHLTVGGLTLVDAPVPPAQVSVYNADWLLEPAPLDLLKEQYLQTEKYGLPMNATQTRDMLPLGFLDQFAPGLVKQILEIHKELLGSHNVDVDSWGQRIRQPIVRRYQVGDRRVLVAVADMAGESFASNSIQDRRNRYLLRNYGTLVWVIDPVICSPFPAFLPPDVADDTVLASMRPDVNISDRSDEIRKDRNHVQRKLANGLAELGTMTEHAGAVQYLLVCVTKADLVRLALNKRSLRDLGAEGEVVAGVARYLVEVARRASGPYPSIKVDGPASRTVIDRISRFGHEPKLGYMVAEQLAVSIVDHYSDPKLFWELVHSGRDADISVREREPSQILHAGQITVPSLAEHIASSLVPGQGGILRIRDLIMSALCCGITYGLGFEESIDTLLQQQWRELRFFLCSPLVEVPVPKASSDKHITPMDNNADFPEFDSRSAALSQLLLSMLRRLRS